MNEAVSERDCDQAPSWHISIGISPARLRQ